MSIGYAGLPKLLFRRGIGAVVGLRVARILIVLVSWLLAAHQLPWHWFAFAPPAEVLAAEFCSGDLPENADPPEVAVGERLFLETRFAQFFFANSNGDADAILSNGDPVMDTTQTTGDPLPGPFAGESMNCRNCHFVDEHLGASGLPSSGVRTYADFARRSPVPHREDGLITTPRNSPPLVDASLARSGGVLFHFDGEFATMKDLIKATFTGRNFGWLPGEEQQAITHIVHIIRDDDGTGVLAQQSGGPYPVVLKGMDPGIPAEFCLPAPFRMINFDTASDEELFDTVAGLVAAYVRSLIFSRDDERAFNASPYDVFLAKNNLPRKPEDESALAYSRRLLTLIQSLPNPQFVTPADGAFQLHNEEFVFGLDALAGLKLFFAEPDEASSQSAGNCIACHMAPNFTDFAFHNTGASQEEYDRIHGQGAFVALTIPNLQTRDDNFTLFLPPTATHPQATGQFRSTPSADKPGFTDLGLWNIFANPDEPNPQEKIAEVLFHTHGRLSEEELLPQTIAVFKTAGLRDLAQSAPYFHTGGKDTFDDVINFYISMANLARTGKLRNPDPEIARIRLTPDDLPLLRAFLQALTEDYS
jgi:cytochrome c peroxidase